MKEPKRYYCGNGEGMFEDDHNHKTGEVRGLLCHNCNVVLGKIKDSKYWLQRALKYI